MASLLNLSMRQIHSLRRHLTLLIIGILAVSLQSVLWASPASGSWKVGTDPTFPPFEFRNPTSGAITGFDVELIEAIGKKSGHSIEWVPLPFDGLIPALQSRSVDAAVSAMTITSERARAVDFSRPYFKAGQAIVVRNNSLSFNTLSELKNRRIAVQIGTTGAQAAEKIPGSQVSSFDTTPTALQELANGNVDAVVSDVPAILYAIDQAKLTGLRISGEYLSTEYYGIAIPTNSPVAPAINQALNGLIQDGQYAKLYKKWFGAEPPELPDRAPSLARPASQLAGLNLNMLLSNLLKGAGVTLMLTVLSFSFGLIGGTALAMTLQAPWVLAHRFCRIYIDFFRGTPMLVQLFLIYFGIPALLQSDVTPFAAPVPMRAGGGDQAAFHCWRTSRGVRPWSAECGL